MGKAERKNLRALFKREEKEVTAILKDWDPIPGSPADEYDCLAHRLLSTLHKGASSKDLAVLIRRELSQHFGIRPSLEEVASVAKRISESWSRRNRYKE